MTDDVDRLDAAGRALWRRVNTEHDLDAVQQVLLVQAARQLDTMHRLDGVLRGEDAEFCALTRHDGTSAPMPVDKVAKEVAASARALAQLLRSLRLADPVTGRRPQRRGPRGVYAPRAPKS